LALLSVDEWYDVTVFVIQMMLISLNLVVRWWWWWRQCDNGDDDGDGKDDDEDNVDDDYDYDTLILKMCVVRMWLFLWYIWW